MRGLRHSPKSQKISKSQISGVPDFPSISIFQRRHHLLNVFPSPSLLPEIPKYYHHLKERVRLH